MDIILDEAPDSITTMQDTFELLESLAAAGVPVPPPVVIEMSGLPAAQSRGAGHAGAGAAAGSGSGAERSRSRMDVESSKAGMNKASAMDKIASAAERWANIGQKPEQQAQ